MKIGLVEEEFIRHLLALLTVAQRFMTNNRSVLVRSSSSQHFQPTLDQTAPLRGKHEDQFKQAAKARKHL